MISNTGKMKPLKQSIIIENNNLSIIIHRDNLHKLSVKGNHNIIFECDHCKKNYIINYYNFNNIYLCKQCKIKQTKLKKYGNENYNNSLKNKQTNLKKYGNENYRNIDKIKQTNLERYGVDNPNKLKKVREKIKQTMLNKYGGMGYGSNEICNKIKQTNLQKYGVEYILQNKEKIKKAIYNKYGVENISQLTEVKNKKKQTNLKNGYNNPYQSDKVKQTIKNKYNVENVFQSKEIQNKIKQTMLNRYGVQNPMQNSTIHNKAMSKFGRKMQLKTINENLHYQSIPELNFIHYCQSNNIDIWDGPSIPYILNNKNHIYHVDFETNRWVVEIKSSHGWYRKDLESGVLGAKNSAAEDYARVVGKEFRFLLDIF